MEIMAKKRKYKSNREENRRKAKEQRRGDFSTLKVPEGVSFLNLKKSVDANNFIELDIIPFATGESTIQGYKTIYIHRNIGPERKIHMCPKTKTKNARCPLCEQYEIDKSDSSLSPKEQKLFKPQIKTLFNVIDLNNRKEGMQLWEVAYFNFTKLLNKRIDADSESARPKGYNGYDDPEEGFTLQVTFTSKSFEGGSPYLEASIIDFERREDSYPDSLVDEALNLNDICDIKSYDELVTIMNGADEEEVSEEEEDDVPYPDEGSDEDEEEESHARKNRSKRKEEEEEEEGNDSDCPEGGKFGIDHDQLDECEDCDVWTECSKEKKALKKARK